MNREASADEIVIRLPRDVARFVERTLWDVAEHFAGGRELVRGPAELEQEVAALMWDLREALGDPHLYEGSRPHSRSAQSYVVE